MKTAALLGASIVLPDAVVSDHALLIADGRIGGLVPVADVPAAHTRCDLGGGWLLPGFIDTQVNGGGDVLLNDQPTVAGIDAIARAHRRFGTTGIMPTLISDDRPVVAAAISATEQAIEAKVPGLLGLHVEGPHLNPGKKGIHLAEKFTQLDESAIALLTAPTLGRRIVTLAPELAAPGAIGKLTDAGIRVCAGHSLADYRETRSALDQGLAGFTHLFNAMNQLQAREPGMVGAALENRDTHFGIIVDGHHVHPATVKIALAARGLDGAMLVTDAMPPVGGQMQQFSLMGQTIRVEDGVCKGADGTLAGSALSMAQAVRNAVNLLGLDIVAASRLASGNPATFLGLSQQTGRIVPGLQADLVHLDDRLVVQRSWIAGELSEDGE
ncbi:N-acetylglucosamine-6-phosphate deacetylase [Stakelama tenebrarum]|uniref:N-acetylglucosamine-6-phosphate deacetylase n=1 Tax=Stakelama tenebrarum TaxID=2711215 RepID=A0A6G6Y6H4_9SPHN|nr:N-acetylglucosamine-6-phosphate deacetylase [Sphingosinithalassobacter tenebrarum]QIG80183.1 N-acetylglucosamine-6-phosphate deacetylase [Sphingosinithalassobacter tenebrarum]